MGKNIYGLDLVVVVITFACLLFLLVCFYFANNMFVYHQGTFTLGLLAWTLHLGFVFWFLFAKNNSVISKEQ